MQPDTHIVVFDGFCNLCSSLVDFITARDPGKVFTFVPMQTPRGQQLLEAHGVSIEQVDTFLLIRGGGNGGGEGGGNGGGEGGGNGGGEGGGNGDGEGGGSGGGGNGEALVRSDAAVTIALEKSDAAMAIAARLRRPWNLLTVLRFVPRPIRDRVYSFVARNRYRWFGKRSTCKLPG